MSEDTLGSALALSSLDICATESSLLLASSFMVSPRSSLILFMFVDRTEITTTPAFV
jgi:hypothetical protein